jgi:hypothetical protein
MLTMHGQTLLISAMRIWQDIDCRHLHLHTGWSIQDTQRGCLVVAPSSNQATARINTKLAETPLNIWRTLTFVHVYVEGV